MFAILLAVTFTASQAASKCETKEKSSHLYGNRTSLAILINECISDGLVNVTVLIKERRSGGEKTLLALADYFDARFYDIDGDDVPEIDFCDNWSTANCSHAIYKYSPANGSIRKVFNFDGTSINKFKGYLVSDIKNGAAERSAQAFKLVDERNLIAESRPRFEITASVSQDEKGGLTCTCRFATADSAKSLLIDPPNAAWTKYCFFFGESGPQSCQLTGKGGKVSRVSSPRSSD
ncbi:MAG TPA: hypothetical protein VI457_04405 [Methylococcaceae bacterium]|nr:hypothetical protein [Methylococcaceae bacterium]